MQLGHVLARLARLANRMNGRASVCDGSERREGDVPGTTTACEGGMGEERMVLLLLLTAYLVPNTNTALTSLYAG